MKTLAEATVMLPAGFEYEYYTAFTKSSIIKCIECDYRQQIIPRNIKETMVCPRCPAKNSIQNKKNEKSEMDIAFSLRNTNLLKCHKGHLLSKKGVNFLGGHCPNCEAEEELKDLMERILYPLRLTAKQTPNNENEEFKCQCDDCGNFLLISLKEAEKEEIKCYYCEEVSPSSNLQRCLFFAKNNEDYISLKHIILFEKDSDGKVVIDLSHYIWCCREGHNIRRPLSKIKKYIKKHGPDKWCESCRHNVLKSSETEILTNIEPKIEKKYIYQEYNSKQLITNSAEAKPYKRIKIRNQ